MTTAADLKAAERAYQRAPLARREQASAARKAIVRQAIADGWTYRDVARTMGKSDGWTGQLLAVKRDPRTVAYALAATDAEGDAAWYAVDSQMAASPTAPQQDRPKAIDRFRRT